MPRPPKPRLVEFVPEVTYFKPAGIPMATLDEVCLGVDELEALRLKDVEGLDQEECARRMSLAQSTFQRILAAAREKLTRAIVEGKALRIEGGNYRFVARSLICPDCGQHWRSEPTAEEATPETSLPEASLPETLPPCPACGSPDVQPRWGRGRGRRHRRGGR